MDKSRFDEIYQIMLDSFPSFELRTREGQEALFDNPRYRVAVHETGGKIDAFLAWWDLPSCVFLEHIATAPASRGSGIGAKLVKERCEKAQKPVFLEIEPVAEKDPMTGRRAGFYRRLGFCVNRFPYLQLPLKEHDRALPLWIMSYQNPVGEAEFKAYQAEIYREVYGKRGE